MPAFVPVPWLNSSDQFLHAITAGAQTGLERARLRLTADQAAGGGGIRAEFLPPGFGAMTPLESANIDLIKARTQDELAQAEAHKNPYHIMSTGLGEIVRVNPITGQTEVLKGERDRQAPPLSPNEAITQAREYLSIIGDPYKDDAAKDVARQGYAMIYKQYPQMLAPLPEVPAAAPASAPVDNSGPGFFSGFKDTWMAPFGLTGLGISALRYANRPKTNKVAGYTIEPAP